MTVIHEMPPLRLAQYKSDILYWSKNFDFSIVEKLVYCQGFSNYDSAYFFCVFIGIDDSIQSMYCESNPFGTSCEETTLPSESSVEYVLSEIKSMEDAISSNEIF